MFVGGVNRSFEELSARLRNREFTEAKGPDFVSRLRGYVDVLGPNRRFSDGDDNFVIRRAVILRQQLKTRMPAIFEQDNELAGRKGEGKARIDPDVLQAFLCAKTYKHGARSMEAIIDMSRIGPWGDRFTKASLPLKEQLEMHVDAADFLRYVGSSSG